MLTRLSIRDLVLIDRLDLEVEPGLTVLTGETGAGKSILLDALGLTLGVRADSALVRKGQNQAVAIAEFDLAPTHPAWELLADLNGDPGEPVLLRRTVSADGRSRAAINDQAASVGLLKSLGGQLAEIQGQFEQAGLMDERSHRATLDAFAGAGAALTACGEAYRAWRQAATAREAAAEALARARAEEDRLRAALDELEAIKPKEGEEEELARRRSGLQNREKLLSSVAGALAELTGDRGVEQRMSTALRALTRLGSDAGEEIELATAALDRAVSDAADAAARLEFFLNGEDFEAGALERIEERLFGLRALARKHGVAPDDLPRLLEQISEDLAAVDAGESGLAALAKAESAARDGFVAAAEALSARRVEAAERLRAAVQQELAPLKLERAVFAVRVERLPEAQWTGQGVDRVAFEIATNPGAAPGPLGKIASGGELSRLLLALKLSLAEVGGASTLIFDEIDSGVGGAVASAIGERLARLGRKVQVLVVTHSPQVAAMGDAHWKVLKVMDGDRAATTVERLDDERRREEIARMLSGAEITDEARAAADRLLGNVT